MAAAFILLVGQNDGWSKRRRLSEVDLWNCTEIRSRIAERGRSERGNALAMPDGYLAVFSFRFFGEAVLDTVDGFNWQPAAFAYQQRA